MISPAGVGDSSGEGICARMGGAGPLQAHVLQHSTGGGVPVAVVDTGVGQAGAQEVSVRGLDDDRPGGVFRAKRTQEIRGGRGSEGSIVAC